MNGNAAMSVNRELMETVRAVLGDHQADVDSGWSAKLWSTLTGLGLVHLSLPERAGGSGGELADVATVLLEAGEAAAPVPLAETELAGWLLHTAGLTVPAGPLAAAAAPPGAMTVDGARVTGSLLRVGWARHATHLVLLVPGPDGTDLVLSVRVDRSGVRPGANVAGEPRDDLILDTQATAAAGAPTGTRALLARRAALYRALLLAGAAGQALAQATRYAGERVQFGRPVGKFQAIQQHLALAAGEAAAGRAAAESAVRVAAATDFAGEPAGLAVACAKARASEAAGPVAGVAHQVLGAIGFTQEHDLRRVTTRLWAWREEDGSDAHWNAEIGQLVLAKGADGLWPLLTSTAGQR